MKKDAKTIQNEIKIAEHWLKLYKQLGQYHQRYHIENYIKKLQSKLKN